MTLNFLKEADLRKLLKESWSIGWPMILIMSFHFAIGITDTYVAGFLGTKVLAAVGYVGQLYWTLMILASGLTVGTVSMISQAYGAKSIEGVSSITANSMLMGLIIAGVMTVLAQIYPAEIIRIAGMPEEIRIIAEDFLKIFSLVLIPTYLMIISGGVLRASGRVRLTMLTSMAAAVVNVILDLVLSFGWGPVPALGYRGIAMATASATTLGMTLNLIALFVGPSAITFSSVIGFRGACMKNLIKLGVPSALQQTAWNAGTLVVYFLVGLLQGGQITALAAMTAGLRIEAIVFLPVMALNMAAAVLIGNRLGAGDPAGARSAAKVTVLLSFSIALIPTALIFIFAPQLAALLTKDPAVLAEMTRYLRVNMVGMPFMAIGITLSGALQGAGDTFGTMRIIFTGMWLLRLPLIIGAIYVFKSDAIGVWWSMTISMIAMCALLIHRFRGDAWIMASMDKENKKMLWEACVKPKAG